MPPTRRRAGASDGTRRLELLRVHAGEQFHVKILSDVSDRIMGLLSHWKGRQSFACLSPCPASLHSIPPQWKGYLAVEVWDEPKGPWYPWVLEVTEACELDMRHKVRRGQVWLVSRALEPTGKRAPVTATLTEEHKPETVSLAFGMLPVIWSVYHDTRVELTLPSPMPDRVWVQAVAAPPPAVLQADPREKLPTAEELAAFRAKLRERGIVPPVNGDGVPSTRRDR